MGTITVSISNEIENKFREAVKAKMGIGKGKLGKAIEEAMTNWAAGDKTKELVERALKKLDEGLYEGKDYTFKREDAYSARVRKPGFN